MTHAGAVTRRGLTGTQGYQEFVKGLWKENPIFRTVLGMCPTMGATGTVLAGLTIGLGTAFAVAMSSFLISVVRTLVPDQIRLVAYMIIIAASVTIVDIFLSAYMPAVRALLGPYVPLIITNCFVLGRAEAFARNHKPWFSLLDALGVGLGFTLGTTFIGIVRELLGFGSVFSVRVLGASWTPWIIMVIPAGAFLMVGILIGLVRHFSPGGAEGGHGHVS